MKKKYHVVAVEFLEPELRQQVNSSVEIVVVTENKVMAQGLTGALIAATDGDQVHIRLDTIEPTRLTEHSIPKIVELFLIDHPLVACHTENAEESTCADHSTRNCPGMYVSGGGVHCPACCADNIEGGEWNSEAGQATQNVRCLNCEARWQDVYTLTTFNLI